jgi:DUF1680 family protein
MSVPTILVWALAAAVAADEPRVPLAAVPIQQVVVDDAFWAPKLRTWRTVTVPDCFKKFERELGDAFGNFDLVRDGKLGRHAGPEWYDGLVYEMIRASSDLLAAAPDAALDRRLDAYIARISAAAARDRNGYLNTWTQLMSPRQRWGLEGGNDVQQHDVYNAGCLVEAAVHHCRATGKTTLLAVAAKLANHMADVMGPPPKHNIVPGHSLPEEALVKLYLLFKERPALKAAMDFPVDEARYLRLAEFWIETRGNHVGRDFGKFRGSYAQDHLPVLQQQTIEGHAVRATLLGAGVVAAANANGRNDYIAAGRRLWQNMVERKMYVIGGLGAVAGHEGFGADYELPNNGYLETCAAIGAAFFHHNLNLATADARCADELERALFNAALPGVSLAGDSYFYENPLEAGPQRRRWSWHPCPCCPPMFLKLMAAMPGLVYAQGPDGVYANMYVGSRATLEVAGARVVLRQTANYPWDGDVRIAVGPDRPVEFALHLRLPGWCEGPIIAINGNATSTEIVRGYARLKRLWRAGDVVELHMPMPVRRVHANPKVAADIGRVALQRGPLVYCVEGVDNGGEVRNLVLPPTTALAAESRPDLLGGVVAIRGEALAVQSKTWPKGSLYSDAEAPQPNHVPFMAIPYFANANRGPTRLAVWLPEDPSRAQAVAPPTIASAARPSASHCNASDTVAALNDEQVPNSSDDGGIPRFTWWDRRGTQEWVQYDFDQPCKVSAVSVYWWDERRIGRHCRIPASWRLLYRAGNEWRQVKEEGAYGVDLDCFNRVEFTPVETTALRIDARLQPGWSSGILEWQVE